MIEKFIITNSLSDTLELELKHPEKSGIFVKDVTGLGYPSSNVSITNLVTSDIGHFNQSIYQSRNVVFTFGFISDVENNRQKIYDVFPSKTEVKVEIVTDVKTVYCKGIVETCEPNIFSNDETLQVSLICPNPYLINISPIIEEFTGTPINVISKRVVEQGYMIEISAPDGIDNIKIEYQNGSIIYGNTENKVPDDESSNLIGSNSEMIIDTSIERFGIYIVDYDTYKLEEITDQCKLIGDFPTFKSGDNIIRYNAVGIFKEYTNYIRTYLYNKYQNLFEYSKQYYSDEGQILYHDVAYPYIYISKGTTIKDGYFNGITFVILDYMPEQIGNETPILLERDLYNISNIIGYIDFDWSDSDFVISTESDQDYNVFSIALYIIRNDTNRTSTIHLYETNSKTRRILDDTTKYKEITSYEIKGRPNELYDGKYKEHINEKFYSNFYNWFIDFINMEDSPIGNPVSSNFGIGADTFEVSYDSNGKEVNSYGKISDKIKTKITIPNYHDGL